MHLPHVARTRGGHIWGETWRILAALAAGLLALGGTWIELDVARVGPRFGEGWLLVDIATGLLATTLLLWRRRWPMAVAVVTTLASGLSTLAVGASGLALISLATRRRWREIGLMSAPWAVSGLVHQHVYRAALDPEWIANVLIGVLSFADAVAIGVAIGERRAFVESLHERALTAEREQALRVAGARVSERTRIAREMHDVLAHRISLVAMHSGVLTCRTDLTADEVSQTAEIVRANANLALSELRSVLGVMREVPGFDAEVGPEPPQPTLADLDALVGETEAAGTKVRVRLEGDKALVPVTCRGSCRTAGVPHHRSPRGAARPRRRLRCRAGRRRASRGC